MRKSVSGKNRFARFGLRPHQLRVNHYRGGIRL